MTTPTYQLSLLPSIDPAARAALVAGLAKIDKSPTSRVGRTRRARAGRTLAAHGAAVLAKTDAASAPKSPWYVLIEYTSEGNERLAFVAGPLSNQGAAALASEYRGVAFSVRDGLPRGLGLTPARIVVLPSQRAVQVVRLADDVSNSNTADVAVAA